MNRPAPPSGRRRLGWALLAAYLVLLGGAALRRVAHPPAPLPPHVQSVAVRSVGGASDVPVRLAFREWGPRDSATIVLLHGSPGDGRALKRLGERLGARLHVVVPDLPGFGSSTRDVPDYSIAAHAEYVRQLLDSLGIGAAHILGFSMGGGVALELAGHHPERVRSLVLLSAIGVQELELLGDYHLNHAIHGLQLGAIWLWTYAVPHFTSGDGMLDLSYARNFYDSDQRPLRGILERYAGPMLILHGDADPLVPMAAAKEHHRIVPQSELVRYRGDHFMAFMRPDELLAPLTDFVARVEAGHAAIRSTARPDRFQAATAPFDPSHTSMAAFSELIVLGLIAVATLVSEDLATISAGLLVARGSLPFLAATLAALVGIAVGDLLLFLGGRLLGAATLHRAPLRWMISPDAVERSRVWFRRRGPVLVLLSRFLPGTRLPTYVAAGMLRMPVATFGLWVVIAATVWTPALVAVAVLFGRQVSQMLGSGEARLWAWVVAIAVLLLAVRLSLRLVTYRGRRLLLSSWRRVTEWEFWPVWLFYLPVVAYVLWLGFKHRSPTLFTAANPSIPGGGLAGESKFAILRALPSEPVAPSTLIPADASPATRLSLAHEFMAARSLVFPVVSKPDVGERGRGVVVVKDSAHLEHILATADSDLVIQAYVPGVEVGVSYYRYPEAERGRVLGVTEKRLQTVTGDGTRTLEALILDDDRAMRQAAMFLRRMGDRVTDVPPSGQVVSLGELGNHSQGAVFLDGRRLMTPTLVHAVDRIARATPGFYIGRFDLRAPTFEDVMAGRRLTVIELNGVSGEPTHIYDPSNTIGNAYRTLFAQWRITFAIGAGNRARGVHPPPLRALLAELWRHWRGRRAALQAATTTAPPWGTRPGTVALSE